MSNFPNKYLIIVMIVWLTRKRDCLSNHILFRFVNGHTVTKQVAN